MKKGLCLLLALILLAWACPAATGEEADETFLAVGNPTPLTGCFFPSFREGTTSDLDVQDLLHAYSPVCWDGSIGHYRFDRSVVQDATALDDSAGNRSYLIVLYDDLYFSDGTPITAYDYAYSVLFSMDPVLREIGGTPADFSWMLGSGEYLSGEAKTLAGLRVFSDRILQLTARADALPYFYELSRLNIYPYPSKKISPGASAADNGEGAYLTKPLTAEVLKRTVTDETSGYLSHPSPVSGPYTLTDFTGATAWFEINGYYKGNEQGIRPTITRMSYTAADERTMIDQLRDGELSLLNKVTAEKAIQAGRQLTEDGDGQYAFQSYPRVGLMLIWFQESSLLAQESAVREAVACCLDRDAFVRAYTGEYGLRTDGYYGIGQWTYQAATGVTDLLERTKPAGTAAEDTSSLAGLEKYETNVSRACDVLRDAGWDEDREGRPYVSGSGNARYRKTENGTAALSLTLAIPDSDRLEEAVRECFLPNLNQAGIRVTLERTDMETLKRAYAGEEIPGIDMIYLGDNFNILYDPERLRPGMDPGTGSLSESRAEAYRLLQEMIRTEPDDAYSFVRKWAALQEQITRTLPLIPIYSNIYFDFYCCELHGYQIAENVTWAQAIVASYMSDVEETVR